MVALNESPFRAAERGSRVTAGSRELGQTQVAEQVFGQKDKWVGFHVWQMWGATERFCYFSVFCPIFRPRGGRRFIFLLFSRFISNLLSTK